MSTQEDIRAMRVRLGKRIIKLRTDMGMTQDQFCELIGMDRTYISGVESGKRNITYDNLARIADGLGITTDVLCENVDIKVTKRMRKQD